MVQEFAGKRKDVESIDNFDSTQFQKFLDSSQYEMNKILRYEKIFGRGYISTGGLTTTEKVQSKLTLQPGMRVLSVGCGIGGGECRLHTMFGVEVHGLDLSHNMLAVARQRAAEMNITSGVTFEHGNVLIRDFQEGEFDVVYTRDCIIHIREKKELFERFFKWLKPGGQLLISDYTCCPDDEKPEEFWKYLADRKYDLRPGNEYLQLIKDAGFANAVREDLSDWFVEILNMEIGKLNAMKDEFLQFHSQKDFNDLEEGWVDKVQRVKSGVQSWSLFLGSKPAQ